MDWCARRTLQAEFCRQAGALLVHHLEQALPPRLKEEVLADAPVIPDRGSYGLPDLVRGPRFEAVVQDLLSDRFRHLVEEKFDIEIPYNANTPRTEFDKVSDVVAAIKKLIDGQSK